MNIIKTHLFIAVPVPDSVKQQLDDWCHQIKKQIMFKKWVYPADYHITLKFLGGVDSDTLVEIKPLIRKITSKESSFSLVLEGLNTFGKMNSPRILWTGVNGEMEPLSILQTNMDSAMESLGFVSENRPYVPHLTLAKNYTGKEAFESQYLDQAAYHLPMALKWEVSEIVLYQTYPKREPMYEPLEAFSLKK